MSIVATTDLHGHVESLPWLAGYLANLRAARVADGGAVVLVDAGDMFQGTLESNLGEGQAVVRGYNALGYDAAAIGNHEFDFGPVGPAHIVGQGAGGASEDPRGALKARAAEARFPFLAANLVEGPARKALAWPNVRPFTVVTAAGLKVGIVGGTTMGTPRATHPRNFAGLDVRPLAQSLAESARAARQAGAEVVIVTTHAGGRCARFDDPARPDGCAADEEIMGVARALPPGLVDAIAAGHTHQAVAHRLAGIPVVQAFSEGRAFARVDLRVAIDGARGAGRVIGARIYPPRGLCAVEPQRVPSFSAEACAPPPYEGRPVRFDTALARLLSPDVARAAALRQRPLGVTVASAVWRQTRLESPLGNLAADLMRAASPQADVAFINGGSLRSDLPAGPLTYGKLYEAFPFDDGLSLVRLTAEQLARVVARNLERSAGLLSLSGLRAVARCRGGDLEVELRRRDGRRVPPAMPLLAVTNGYLAMGGDGLLQGIASGEAPSPETMRDQLVSQLRARSASAGPLRGDDPSLFDKRRPRLAFPGSRPVRCPLLDSRAR